MSPIKPRTPVVCSEQGHFGVVEHVEGTEMIKLAKDAYGKHHYIPMKWVTAVDDRVHIDRPRSQAMREWCETATACAKVRSIY